MAVALNLAACAQNSKEEVANISKKLQGGKSKTATDPKAESNPEGQPGLIVISGVVVGHDGAHIKTLDPRIKVAQTTGVVGKDKIIEKVDEDHRVKLMTVEDAELANVASNQEFVNFGCPEVDPQVVAGLTEKKDIHPAEGATIVAVNTVVICGEQKTSFAGTSIKADLLIMKGANIKDSSVKGFDLSARRVMLIDENRIESKSLDFKMDAPAVNLNIQKDLWGEGTLTIVTQGANEDDGADSLFDQMIQEKDADASGTAPAAAPEGTSAPAADTAASKTSGAVQK
jgi:hypothetical protein